MSTLRKLYSKDRTLPAMMAKFRQFLTDESGATAIEYRLINDVTSPRLL